MVVVTDVRFCRYDAQGFGKRVVVEARRACYQRTWINRLCLCTLTIAKFAVSTYTKKEAARALNEK